MRYSAALLKRLDDFRFANRLDSRAEAIRWLIQVGLDKKLKPAKGNMSENWQMLLYLGALLTGGQAASHSTRPFGLKGDVLGETIQEFRIHNDRTISTPIKSLRINKHQFKCA